MVGCLPRVRRAPGEAGMKSFLVRIIELDDGSYRAECLSLPGCVSRGRSYEEASERLEDAIKGYLAAVGNFVPGNLVQEYVASEQGQLIA